jgi:hypothetical protein
MNLTGDRRAASSSPTRVTPPLAERSDLAPIEAATLFVLTASGRIQCENDPPRSHGPRMYLGGCEAGNVARIRHDVGDDTARAIEALAADEPPLAHPSSTPEHLDNYVQLLAREAPIEQQTAGLTFYAAGPLEYEHDVTLVCSDTPAGDRMLATIADQGMPPSLVALGFTALWPPWCVALHDGAIASVAETVRSGESGVEAGITTVPELRRRGFAAAATAGWAAHPALDGRVRFYSTQRANVASQGVARRLGLRFVGANLRVV